MIQTYYVDDDLISVWQIVSVCRKGLIIPLKVNKMMLNQADMSSTETQRSLANEPVNKISFSFFVQSSEFL